MKTDEHYTVVFHIFLQDVTVSTGSSVTRMPPSQFDANVRAEIGVNRSILSGERKVDKQQATITAEMVFDLEFHLRYNPVNTATNKRGCSKVKVKVNVDLYNTVS